MAIRHFCTYFDHNYLSRGIVMLESLHKHCSNAHVHVLCLSDVCHSALTAQAYPFASLIRLSELEAADYLLAASKSTRTLIEYYFTITPCLPNYLLHKYNLDGITYLDADMLFFSSPEPLFAEAEQGGARTSVIITPHRFSPKLEALLPYGQYNVSWITYYNTDEGRACLSWYRDACLAWCRDELDDDRFADQKYLDSFQKLFSGVHVMRNIGGGVAPWNVSGLSFAQNKEKITVNGEPLIFYHAQGFKQLTCSFYASGLRSYGATLNNASLRHILRLYARKYANATRRATALTAQLDFSGIRLERRGSSVLARKIKCILKELLYGTLVYI